MTNQKCSNVIKILPELAVLRARAYDVIERYMAMKLGGAEAMNNLVMKQKEETKIAPIVSSMERVIGGWVAKPHPPSFIEIYPRVTGLICERRRHETNEEIAAMRDVTERIIKLFPKKWVGSNLVKIEYVEVNYGKNHKPFRILINVGSNAEQRANFSRLLDELEEKVNNGVGLPRKTRSLMPEAVVADKFKNLLHGYIDTVSAEVPGELVAVKIVLEAAKVAAKRVMTRNKKMRGEFENGVAAIMRGDMWTKDIALKVLEEVSATIMGQANSKMSGWRGFDMKTGTSGPRAC